MSRGSVWVRCKFYLTTARQQTIAPREVYGYSRVDYLDTQGQRETLFKNAIQKAKFNYRQQVGIDSDVVVNYSLIDSGTQTVNTEDRRIKWRHLRMSGADKRRVHKQVLIDTRRSENEKYITREQQLSVYQYEKDVKKAKKEKKYNEVRKSTYDGLDENFNQV